MSLNIRETTESQGLTVDFTGQEVRVLEVCVCFIFSIDLSFLLANTGDF